jgi:hypothetical protein
MGDPEPIAITLERSTISDNHAERGAGLDASGTELVVRESTVNGNRAEKYGGGLYVADIQFPVLIVRSAFYDNSAIGADTGTGGAIFSRSATVAVVNSTISGNRARMGGGGVRAHFSSNVYFFNATVVDNMLVMGPNNLNWNGGGIQVGTNSSANLGNTVLARNLRSGLFGQLDDNCAGLTLSFGYNLVGSLAGCDWTDGQPTDIAADPQLGLLQDNGGPSLTHMPSTGSPLIDKGNPNGCAGPQGNALTTDQRGAARPVDGGSGQERCDIGAVEYASDPPAPPLPPPPPPPPAANYTLYLPVVRR